MIFIILIIIAAAVYFAKTRGNFFETKSGYTVMAGNKDTADVMDELINISKDVPNKLKEPYKTELINKCNNTFYREIRGYDKKIVGWNKGKGREIGIRIMKTDTVPYSAGVIIDTLLHELAHNITDSLGHGAEWYENNDYFQKLKPYYVRKLINKTFIKY